MRVNEIFYSLQGEGRFTGVAATFIRLAGCNLQCDFCDTHHQKYSELSVDEIVANVVKNPSRHVVITGGEPSIHHLPPLIDALHQAGCYVQVETNGTNPLPDSIDWITCSPKDQKINLTRIHELKLLFLPRYLDGNDSPDDTINRLLPSTVNPIEFRLQPCDVGEPYSNSRILDATINYILRNPQWQLSLQTHKLLNIQ